MYSYRLLSPTVCLSRCEVFNVSHMLPTAECCYVSIIFQMWMNALSVRVTAASLPPATTRQAHTSANARTATGGWAMTANVRLKNTNLSSQMLKKGGVGVLTICFLCSVLMLKSKRKGGIPLQILVFVMAVSLDFNHSAPSARSPFGHFNQGKKKAGCGGGSLLGRLFHSPSLVCTSASIMDVIVFHK